jgi:hypothetical protein
LFPDSTYGKEYKVSCPDSCIKKFKEEPGKKPEIYGTTYYKYTSSICKAAVHMGILAEKGGKHF